MIFKIWETDALKWLVLEFQVKPCSSMNSSAKFLLIAVLKLLLFWLSNLTFFLWDFYFNGNLSSLSFNVAQAAIKNTFLASAIRKCGGNEEKGRLLYTAYGSNGQVCLLYWVISSLMPTITPYESPVFRVCFCIHTHADAKFHGSMLWGTHLYLVDKWSFHWFKLN